VRAKPEGRKIIAHGASRWEHIVSAK